MSGSNVYVLDANGVSHDVSNVTFNPTSFGQPDGATGSYVSFLTSDYIGFASGLSSFTISDFVGGVEVGKLKVDQIISSYSLQVSRSPTLVFGDGILATDVVCTGDFTQDRPCFVAGTNISTPDGEREVSALKPGDMVTLASGNSAAVVWTGHRRSRGLLNDAPVIFRPGSLGPCRPSRELRVSPDHAMLIEDVLVPAFLLVNGSTICRADPVPVTYHHIELYRHGILLAEGAPAERYLDSGNRRQFSNCPLSYNPVHAFEFPCLLMVFAGERLEAIWASLRGHAHADADPCVQS